MNWREIDVKKYLYLNYFCKGVVRHGKGRILPYKNSVIDLAKTSELHVYDGNVSIGVNKLKGSMTETYIRLRDNAKWNVKEHCEISYGSTIEVLSGAKFDSQYFTMNSFSTIVAGKQITFGHDVMIARNVVIYDSDFHVIEVDGEEMVKFAEVVIGNHVWVAANSVILKGTKIEDGSVISANTLVTKDIDTGVLVGNEKKQTVLKKQIEWKR